MTDGVSARGKESKEIIERKKSCKKLFKKLGISEPTFLTFLITKWIVYQCFK